MKQLLFTLFFAVSAFAAWAGNYRIVVNFPDMEQAGQTVCLTNYDSGDTLLTAPVKGAVAVLRGQVEGNVYSRLAVGSRRCEFVLEPGNIVVDWKTGDATGTPLNATLNQIAAAIDSATTDQQAIDVFHRAYLSNRDNCLGPWACYSFMLYSDFNLQQIDSAMAALPAAYQQSRRLASLRKSAVARDATAVGKMFTDFTVTGDDGQPHSLSYYVARGTYTLVDFWASWCGPCRREMPNLKRLYDQYNGHGMNFLGVAVWDQPADTRRAISQLQLPWPVIVGDKRLTLPTDLYGIMGIPHIIIFDPQGRIVARGLQGEELSTFVTALMANN